MQIAITMVAKIAYMIILAMLVLVFIYFRNRFSYPVSKDPFESSSLTAPPDIVLKDNNKSSYSSCMLSIILS